MPSNIFLWLMLLLLNSFLLTYFLFVFLSFFLHIYELLTCDKIFNLKFCVSKNCLWGKKERSFTRNIKYDIRNSFFFLFIKRNEEPIGRGILLSESNAIAPDFQIATAFSFKSLQNETNFLFNVSVLAEWRIKENQRYFLNGYSMFIDRSLLLPKIPNPFLALVIFLILQHCFISASLVISFK